MASRSDLDRLIAAKNAATGLARRDLERFWASLDFSDPAVWQKVTEFLPLLVARYGESAALVAADWYDELRDMVGAPGRYGAAVVAADDGPLIGRLGKVAALVDRPDSALSVVGALVSEWVNRWTAGTVQRAAAADPAKPRIARVPKGVTCAWCLMLASRGAVYASEGSALAASHGDCDCVLTPTWDGRLPHGYDPDHLADQYSAARGVAGGSRADILAELRRQQGIN